jgi:hypothetical protein
VIASVARAFGAVYTHNQISALIALADVEPAVAEGNREQRCRGLLDSVNMSDKEPPLSVLGRLLEEMMDGEDGISYIDELAKARQRVTNSLAASGLAYSRGGIVGKAASSRLSHRVDEIAKAKNLAGVTIEFDRIYKNLESDPGAATTASCALLEALLKVYIDEDETLSMPSDQSIGTLWKVMKNHLHLDPASVSNDDLRKILSGLSSLVNGLGALRTHHGSAHGRATVSYRLLPRHARLAAHASFTLCAFIIETMQERENR